MTRALLVLLVLAFAALGTWMLARPGEYLRRWHQIYANYPWARFFQRFVRDTPFNRGVTRAIGLMIMLISLALAVPAFTVRT
jgi:hypothetical protein